MIKLKELRNKSGYSQQFVAEQLGITQQAYANYERGARQADYSTLNKLAEIFNSTVDYILGRTDEPNSDMLDKQLEGVEFALWGEVHDLTEEEKQDILDFVKFTKSKRKDNTD